MTGEERNLFMKRFLDEFCFPVVTAKGKEYSRGEKDCLSNFKRLADSLNVSPALIAWIYLVKHLDAISYFIKAGKSESNESIESRIGDAINYLLILACLISERQ